MSGLLQWLPIPLFGWNPWLIVFASVTLFATIVAAVMGSLVFMMLPAPATRVASLRRRFLSFGFQALIGLGLVVGLLGLFIAL